MSEDDNHYYDNVVLPELQREAEEKRELKEAYEN